MSYGKVCSTDKFLLLIFLPYPYCLKDIASRVSGGEFRVKNEQQNINESKTRAKNKKLSVELCVKLKCRFVQKKQKKCLLIKVLAI